MKHKTAWPDPEYRYGQPTDAQSRATCNLNHLVPCPRHHPEAYSTRAEHKGPYRGEDLVMSL